MQRSKPRYAVVEDKLLKLFRGRRNGGHKVSALWMQAKARLLAKEFMPGERFFASHGWLRRLAMRNNLSPRSKTNVKLQSVSERLPRVRHWHRGLRKFLKMPISEGTPLDPVWGRYPPELRFNMDQVPLPFIQELDRT